MRCWSVFDGSNDFVHYPGIKNQNLKLKQTNSLAITKNSGLVFHPSAHIFSWIRQPNKYMGTSTRRNYYCV